MNVLLRTNQCNDFLGGKLDCQVYHRNRKNMENWIAKFITEVEKIWLTKRDNLSIATTVLQPLLLYCLELYYIHE